MKSILCSTVLLVFIIAACSKKDTTPTKVIQPDVLTQGWVKLNLADTFGISDIYFTDTLNGYAVSDDVYGIPNAQGLYKSNDGGVSWNKISNSDIGFNIAAYGFNAVFAGATNSLFYTTDNGNIINIRNYNSITQKIYDAYFASNNICYAVSYNAILKSTNGGVDFAKVRTIIPSTNSSYLLASLSFISEQEGWVTNGSGNIYHTSNGGLNWDSTVLNERLNVPNFVNQSTGYITSTKSVFKTTNGSLAWNKIYTYTDTTGYHDIHFVNENLGYIIEGKKILKTTDGGSTWNTVVTMGEQEIIEIHFVDANHGWACGGRGAYLKFSL